MCNKIKLQNVTEREETMDEKMRISNAEMKVMNQIWKAEEMVTVPEVLEILKKEGEEWTYPTVATLF